MNRVLFWSGLLLPFLVPAVAAAQESDLGDPYTDAEHEIEIRPPAGWRLRMGSGPIIVKFVGDRDKAPAQLNLLHYYPEHPVPLDASISEIRTFLKEEFKKVEMLSEGERTIGGRPAKVLVFRTKYGEHDFIVERTLIFRSHREYFIADLRCLASAYKELGPLVAKSVGTIRIRPMEFSIEERAARSRTRSFLEGANLGTKQMEGETWQGLIIRETKTGWQREKVTAAVVDGREGFQYEFETQLLVAAAGKSHVTVRGAFTRDGSYQEVSGKHVLTPEGKKPREWKYRMVLKGTEVQVERTLVGFSEQKTITVPAGTLLKDLVSIFRRSIVSGKKETFLVSYLDPFCNETGREWLELQAEENLKLDSGGTLPCRIIFAKVDRRQSMTYYYGTEGKLLKVRSGAALFQIVAMSREEALAK